MALPARDHVKHLAELDAEKLAVPFREIPSQAWDGLANAARYKAADDAGLTDTGVRHMN